MKLSTKSEKAIKEFVRNRKKYTGHTNHDPEMITDALIELGIAAYETDCWGDASVSINDEGVISMRG
jgi:hypothetical protein